MFKKGEDLKNRVGEKHTTNEGYSIEIVEYFNKDNCTIQFQDGIIIKNKMYKHIVKGYIKNPLHKSVFGVGYFGVSEYRNISHSKIYKTWSGMLERCYYSKYQEKHPSYKGCSVDEKWHNFQNFALWFEENYKENCALDKDILVKGNKIYSPETCCFVSTKINLLFVKCNNLRGKYPIGVSKKRNRFKAAINISSKAVNLGVFDTPKEAFLAYKTAKEAYIKEVAEKWKPKISEKVYKALISYKVEITD